MRNKLYILVLLLWSATSVMTAQTKSASVTSDSVFVKSLRQMRFPITNNNRIVLLHSGYEKFQDMFAAIRQARHSIHLEYFNFRNDSIGNALFDLLAEKAQEGVTVRALFDSFGNSSNNRPLKNSHIESIRQRGVQIYEFDPIRFPWVNHAVSRDHRKIVIIDGEVAYTGGMNVADYYIHGHPSYGDWRDMHMRLEGSAIEELQRIFYNIWKEVTGEQIADAGNFPGYRDAQEHFQGLKPDTTRTAGQKMVAIVDRQPRVTPKAVRHAYIAAIDAAQEHIQIVNPYFTLVPSLTKALHRALERGVRLDIMVSVACDEPITPDVVAQKVHNLMKRGAHIHYYYGGFHHTKTMMVDGLYCTLGSTNLDARSLRFDAEVNAFIIDRPTTAQLMQSFEEDLKHCKELTPELWKERSKSSKVIGRLFGILTPFL